MEIEQVNDFVKTVNAIKENFCSFDGNILTVTTTEGSDPVTIELSDIESIELTRKKFTGIEVLIRSLSGAHILAFAFANRREEILFDIENVLLGAYQRFFWPVAGFLTGSVFTAAIFLLCK